MAINQDDNFRPNPTDPDARRQTRLDNNAVQPDPQLTERPSNGGKVAMFAVAIAVVLGAVFYGLNNSTVNEAGTTPSTSTAQNTERTSPPTAPTGMRDVTPGTNTAPGTTTGAAPARPQTPAPAPAVNPPASPAPSR